MKYFLIALFFIQLSATAETNNLANQICNEYPLSTRGFGTTKSDCLEVITGKVMNNLAVQICNEYPLSTRGFGTTKLSCLEVIAGRVMNDSDVQNCNKYPLSTRGFGTTKMGCLQELSDQSELAIQSSEEPVGGAKHDSSADTQAQPQSRDIKTEAIEFCRNEVDSHNKGDCLGIIVPAKFIDEGAFDLCKKQDSYRYVDCFATIVNKTYHPSVIEECVAEDSHNQIGCLSKYGSPIESTEDDGSIVIIIQNGEHVEQGLPECKYENFDGLYPEGGGCNFDGCWIAGGGCNFHGCWYPGGGCNFDGCVKEAPKDNICQQ